jgi:hypothetical protein
MIFQHQKRKNNQQNSIKPKKDAYYGQIHGIWNWFAQQKMRLKTNSNDTLHQYDSKTKHHQAGYPLGQHQYCTYQKQ